MVEIKWTDFAIENLNAIGDYIEKDSFRYAEIVVNFLFDSANMLEQHQLIYMTPKDVHCFLTLLICNK